MYFHYRPGGKEGQEAVALYLLISNRIAKRIFIAEKYMNTVSWPFVNIKREYAIRDFTEAAFCGAWSSIAYD